MRTVLSTLILVLAVISPSVSSASIPSFAQRQAATGTLRVRVLNSGGSPVEGARVRNIRDDRVTREQSTNAQGVAVFDDVVAGSVMVRAGKRGIGFGRAQADIQASETTDNSITLHPRRSKK